MDLADQIPPADFARPALVLAALLDPAGIPGVVFTSPAACGYLTGHPAMPAEPDSAPLVLPPRPPDALCVKTNCPAVEPLTAFITLSDAPAPPDAPPKPLPPLPDAPPADAETPTKPEPVDVPEAEAVEAPPAPPALPTPDPLPPLPS